MLLLCPQQRRSIAQESTTQPQIQVVLFTSAGVAPPAGNQARLTEIADYTDKFFHWWMDHWKYPIATKSLFERDAKNQVVVRYAQGEREASSGAYDKPALYEEAYAKVSANYDIPRNGHVWWIHAYLGTEKEFKDYRGWGNSTSGGTAVARYSTMPGKIDLRQQMLEGFHEKYHLKGIVHELGHALGLPHMGPLDADRFGNPLMGPNQFEWAKLRRPEPRIYLNEASAAMLWKHPIFSGTAAERGRMPIVVIDRLQCRFDRAKNRLTVSGQLQSNINAHSAIVLDASKAAPNEYWMKTYATRLTDDGSFEVNVTDLAKADGELKLFFCFDNGMITGDGVKQGLQSAHSIPYLSRNLQYEFPVKAAPAR